MPDVGNLKLYRCPRALMDQLIQIAEPRRIFRDSPSMAALLYPQPTSALVDGMRAMHAVEALVNDADHQAALAEARRRGSIP